ncbi:MAG: hypothetical protein JXB33_01870 [Clostridia bacterium]|nr:hypothetical protein [Clostridia bacterium]
MAKKIIFIILAVLIAAAFTGCGEKDSDPEIVGIISETQDGSFNVDVIGGFQEDIMKVYITKKTKFAEGATNEMAVGMAVGFTIEGDVRESYPVQVDARKIRWNEEIITGTILSAGETALLVSVAGEGKTVLMQVLITEETLFYNNIPPLMEKTRTVGFTISGENPGTEPIQVFTKRIVTYD